jgi:D-beta-D-heptose 7-phosphate kinase/D-beta-D-heptose 1-phosphate adenosyltransferase
VHLVTEAVHTAGGAANVARNIQLVGGQAILGGVLGADEAAGLLRSIMERDGIDVSAIVTDPDRPTVKKTRISSNHHQIVRIDWEKTHALSRLCATELVERLLALDVDGYVVSDYGKGSLTTELLRELFERARRRGKPIIVDPKGRDYHRYEGATLVTPNRKEALEALGLEPNDRSSPQELASKLQQNFGLGAVLVTLGSDGMFGLPAPGAKEPPLLLRARAREVFDVSGAGDTVAAICALALASGANLAEAMNLANLAAGRVVEKWGTQPILHDELAAMVAPRDEARASLKAPSLTKIVSEEGLLERVGNDPLQRSRRLVFTNGCFDILHAGHASYLEEARALGDCLVVAVNSDESVRRLKGPTRPIVPLHERMRLIAALGAVDYVVAFDDDTPERLIRRVVPNYLVKGADYSVENIVGAEIVVRAGGSVQTIEFVDGISSSAIIRRVSELVKN